LFFHNETNPLNYEHFQSFNVSAAYLSEHPRLLWLGLFRRYHVRSPGRGRYLSRKPMDLSKLPKLSQTTQRTDPIEPGSQAPASQLPAEPTAFCPACGSPLRASARFCDSCGAPTRTPAGRAQAGAEAWISIAIAAILLFLFPNLMVYLFHPGTTRFDATDTGTGASIPYAHSAFIWPDVGVTFFCFVLILDAVLMLILPKRGVVMLAFAL